MGDDVGETGGGALFERLARTREILERERSGAPALLTELLAAEPARQLDRVTHDPRFQTWGLCELLLEIPSPADFAETDRRARLVLAAADHLGDRHPAPLVEDLRARAWARVGEACLATADLAGAETALRTAATCLGHGTGDLLVDARLLEFEAAVRCAQGRPGDAIAPLRQAAARYRKANEVDHLARVVAWREALQDESRPSDGVPHYAFGPLR
ncbi:MAG TPA: hypothetical protein VFE33_30970 [Thermoanaerobaculia bacterium]|nr:hypothetical protein [Thermoanaerobaculia bacterium]